MSVMLAAMTQRVNINEVPRWATACHPYRYAKYCYDVPTVQQEPLAKMRADLLDVKGVGQETADSILLYAFGFPTFAVDAYTTRLCGRYPVDAGKGYAAVKAHFEDKLPRSAKVYNTFQALIVINAKEHCRKKPSCTGCSIAQKCEGAKLSMIN